MNNMMSKLTAPFRPASREEIKTVTAAPFAMVKRNVFFLDDDPTICDLMRVVAERHNVTLTISNTVKDAREVCLSSPHRFDLYILDVVLSNGSGIELYRELMERYPQVDIAFLTGNDSPAVREKIQAVGPARIYGKDRAMTVSFLDKLFAQLGFIRAH